MERILLSHAATPLKELATELAISVPSHASAVSVVDLFHKYNLTTLPVVDDKRHLIG